MDAKKQPGVVLAVCQSSQPGLPKLPVDQIQLIKDHGVKGDYHAGKFIRHRYLAKKDPQRLNNRQVLLVDAVIHTQVLEQGIQLAPGDLGENMLVDGIDVMSLQMGTKLEIGSALIEITEIRDPCYQLDEVHSGLQEALELDDNGTIVPRAGMLGVVLHGGNIRPGDEILIKDPEV